MSLDDPPVLAPESPQNDWKCLAQGPRLVKTQRARGTIGEVVHTPFQDGVLLASVSRYSRTFEGVR